MLNKFADTLTMSRWKLLKSAIAGKRDSESLVSIHKFNGFAVCERKKVIWKGFMFRIAVDKTVTSPEQLLCSIHQYLTEVDTCECLVVVFASDSTSVHHVDKILLSGLGLNYWTICDETVGDNNIYLKVNHKSLQPTLRICEYTVHTLRKNESNMLEDLVIFTREKPKQSGLTANALLSNRLHNVDNTGNICVWPSESILLCTFLTNARYSTLIRQANRIIELGGGLTALAGLGLAASKLYTGEIVTTDGHPDCVANQVS